VSTTSASRSCASGGGGDEPYIKSRVLLWCSTTCRLNLN
jgi:hypothetical protein